MQRSLFANVEWKFRDGTAKAERKQDIDTISSQQNERFVKAEIQAN